MEAARPKSSGPPRPLHLAYAASAGGPAPSSKSQDPAPGIELELSRGDLKVTLRCFQPSFVSEMLPAAQQIVRMLEAPTVPAQPSDTMPYDVQQVGSSRTSKRDHTPERPMRSQWTSVQYVAADEDNVVPHYKRIPVFCSDLELVRCTEHGAEYKSDGGFYIPVSLRGLVFKEIDMRELAGGDYHWGHVYTVCLELRDTIVQDPHRPRNAVEKHWEGLDHCRSRLHNPATTQRLSLFLPTFLEVLSSRSLSEPALMTMLEEFSPLVMRIKGFDVQISGVRVVRMPDNQPCAILPLFKHDDNYCPRVVRGKSVYYFTHATYPQAATSILAARSMLPSFYDEQDSSWLPPYGFYARAQRAKSRLAIESMEPPSDNLVLHALKFSDIHSVKSIMICGLAFNRQTEHAVVQHGGVAAEIAANYYYDVVHGVSDRDGSYVLPLPRLPQSPWGFGSAKRLQ